MIFGLAAAAAFYVTKGQLWTDIKNGLCSGGSSTSTSSPNPNYEEITNINESEDNEAGSHSLLLEQGGILNESARASINKARESLHGSDRDVSFNSVIY
jgi:hypothetical protein